MLVLCFELFFLAHANKTANIFMQCCQSVDNNLLVNSFSYDQMNTFRHKAAQKCKEIQILGTYTHIHTPTHPEALFEELQSGC